jgi:mRNA-degrading endonuclease RelE of RelBE toxin-antitoxin system
VVPYRFQFAESAEGHLAQLTARQQSIVLEAVKVQLRFEPLRETRKRKQLRPNPFAPWELRLGALRVFYEVDPEEADLVNILAVGIKRGNRLFVAGKEIRI